MNCRFLMTIALLLGALVFGSALPVHAQQSKGFQAGKQAFDAGEFLSAYAIFQELIQQQPGNAESDFYLGRSAFEIGDYESAIFAFERILMTQPQADRVRLELGRSYFSIGDLQAARRSFEQVLDNQPPAAVRANIERYLLLVEQAMQQHKFGGYLSVGVRYDSNIYSAPVDEQIQTVIGSATLNGAGSSPEEDFISQNSFRLDHIYQQHPKSAAWRSSALMYSAIYAEESSLNLNLLSLSSGPIWQRGRHRGELRAQVDYLTLNEERYLSQVNLAGEYSWAAKARVTYGLVAEISDLNYAYSPRDASRYRLTLTQLINWSQSRLFTTIGLEDSNARDEVYSYLRKRFSINYEQQLSWQLTGSVGVRFWASDYAEEIAMFGKKRRDHLRELSLGLRRPLWRQENGPAEVQAQLSVTLNDTQSNIDLYEYDKQVVSFVLNYLF